MARNASGGSRRGGSSSSSSSNPSRPSGGTAGRSSGGRRTTVSGSSRSSHPSGATSSRHSSDPTESSSSRHNSGPMGGPLPRHHSGPMGGPPPRHDSGPMGGPPPRHDSGPMGGPPPGRFWRRPPRRPGPPRGPGYNTYYSGHGRRSPGCLTGIVTFMLLAIVMAASIASMKSCTASGTQDRPSSGQDQSQTGQHAGKTQSKEPESGGSGQQTSQASEPPSSDQKPGTGATDNSYSAMYYTDLLEWIKKPDVLISGMKVFQEKTGVKPYLYLTDEINGSHNPSDEEIDRFANSLYDQLFTDENHFMFLFMEYGDTYISWYVCGSDAGSVMDDDAVEVFLNFVDEYYSSDMEDEEFFCAVFEDTADKIAE